MKKGLIRFFKYALVGGSTFAFDLLILWAMTELLSIPYYVSTPLAFVIAVSLNYLLSRQHVFVGTERGFHTGYAYFIGFAFSGAFLITSFVTLLVVLFSLNYLVARVLVACVVGIANYLFNLHFNFKVAGKHH